MNGLRLDLSLRQFDGGDTLGATYRDEGLSVGADHMVRMCSGTAVLVSFTLTYTFMCSVFTEKMSKWKFHIMT